MSALLRSAHPIPAAGVTIVAVLLGVAVGLDGWRVALLGLVMALDQLSVGWSNDWIDADRDRVAGRTDKPVAGGEISVRTVRAAAIGAAVASIALPIPLGWPAVLAHAVVLAGGWAYNAGLKATPLSAVPYLVTFGALPGFATLAAAEPELPPWWAVATGALLGLAAHIANVLPDLDDDRRTGIRGLPHRLGPRLGTIVAGAALAGAAVILLVGVGPTPVSITGVAASAAISGAAVALGLRGSRAAFRLVILAALVDVVLLVLVLAFPVG